MNRLFAFAFVFCALALPSLLAQPALAQNYEKCSHLRHLPAQYNACTRAEYDAAKKDQEDDLLLAVGVVTAVSLAISLAQQPKDAEGEGSEVSFMPVADNDTLGFNMLYEPTDTLPGRITLGMVRTGEDAWERESQAGVVVRLGYSVPF